jgi:hypothetical protein
MARAKAQGIFVVTPVQFDESESLQGISFATATQASKFANDLQKFVKRSAAKIKGLSGEDAKNFKGGVGLDILMQPTDADGEPTGNPALFDTVGVEADAE